MVNAEQYVTGIAQKRADFAYNNSGQYSKITRYSDINGTTEVSHSDYGYDSAKRLTSLVHRNSANTALVTYGWTYDNQGRVKTFTNPDGTVTYTYDANDLRLSKTVTVTGQNPVVERYVYDGDELLAVMDGGGVVKARYFNGPGTDQLLGEESFGSDGTTFLPKWPLSDHQGSVRIVATYSGNYGWHGSVNYDSFGNVQAGSYGLSRFAFAG